VGFDITSGSARTVLVKRVSCQHDMVRSQLANIGYGLEILSLIINILNIQLWTADKG
jgi:hypothetical protein